MPSSQDNRLCVSSSAAGRAVFLLISLALAWQMHLIAGVAGASEGISPVTAELTSSRAAESTADEHSGRIASPFSATGCPMSTSG